MAKEYILDWFAKKSTMSREELEKDLDINYFESGLIDSFAFLELTTACEKDLNIAFEDDDFADDAFFTVSGLIRIIEKKLQ